MTDPSPPTIGRIVHYRTKHGDYYVPAIVNSTVDSLGETGLARNAERVAAGDEQSVALDSPMHANLTVFGPLSTYHEVNVPYDEGVVDGHNRADGAPRTWRWPRYDPTTGFGGPSGPLSA